MSAWTRLAATCENLIAVTCMLWMSNCRYSDAYFSDQNSSLKKLGLIATHLLKILLLCLLQLLPKEEHNLLHVPTVRHTQHNRHRFPHCYVPARQDLEDVHDEPVEHVCVFGTQRIEAVEDDEFDVVVRFFDDEIDKT